MLNSAFKTEFEMFNLALRLYTGLDTGTSWQVIYLHLIGFQTMELDEPNHSLHMCQAVKCKDL